MTVRIHSAQRTSKAKDEWKEIPTGGPDGDLPRATAWTLVNAPEHPSGLLVMVRTKDRDYEVIISRGELELALLAIKARA